MEWSWAQTVQSCGRVLFISGTEGDTRRYRCFHQQEQLALNGVESAFREADDFHIPGEVLNHDFFILHRVSHSELIGDILELIGSLGKIAIFDTDDLTFDPSLLSYQGIMDTLSPEAQRRYRIQMEGQAQTFRRCSYVLTATEFLAEAARQQGKKAFVNRNSLSQEMLTISEEAYEERQRRQEAEGRGGEDRLSIAYFSGSGSHNRDFLMVTDPLVDVLKTYDHVELHIGGQLDLSEKLKPFAPRIKRTPYLPWRELPSVIAGVDINLAPLEAGNPFCRAKSALKYFEAGVVGVPTIASHMEPFERAIIHGTNGLLTRSEEEWVRALSLLIENGEKRRSMGEAARRDVYQHYLPEQRGHHLVLVLKAIQRDWQTSTRQSTVRSTAGGGPGPFVDPQRAVTSALERQISRQQELIAQKDAQLCSQRRVIQDRERDLSRLQSSLSREKEALQAYLEAQLSRWRSVLSSEQEGHQEDLRHILLSLQDVDSGEMVTESSTVPLMQQIEKSIRRMREEKRIRESGLCSKIDNVWRLLHRGQFAALKSAILSQLRKES